jgi:hypothetical protein
VAFVADGQAAVAGQPGDGAFDDPAVSGTNRNDNRSTTIQDHDTTTNPT